jgi:xylulokinase
MGIKDLPLNEYLLGIDIGTERCKALLFSLKGRRVAYSHDEYSVDVQRPSWAEQDPLVWWEAVRHTIKEVIKKADISAEDVDCVSLTGQSPVLVCVDKRGKPLTKAIIWMDRRAVDETRRLLKETGLKEDPSMILPKIMWLREHMPSTFAEAYKFLQATDFVGHLLTGGFATDPVTASTIHYDAERQEYPEELLCKLKVPLEKLPNVLFPTNSAEVVSGEASRLTGLKKGTPVVLAGIDAYMAMIGVNALEPGHACEITGTSTCIMVPSSQKIVDAKGRIECSPFPSVADLWILWGMMSSTGASLNWYRDTFAQNESFEEIDSEASDTPAGSSGLIFLPYMMGERSPIWDSSARGVFAGLSLNHTRNHFVRAILEGCAFGIRHNLETIEDLSGKITEIWSCGGAANSRIFGQIKADVLGKSMIIPREIEAPALGAAIVGALNIKAYKSLSQAGKNMVSARCVIAPHESAHEKYKRFYAMYRDLYEALKRYFNRYYADQPASKYWREV